MTAPLFAHARTPLTEADIQRLFKGDNADDRAIATHKICRIMERSPLSEAERDAAQDIIRMLAQDAAELVRRALSVTLRSSDLLPHDVAMSLASDVLSVAVPVISHSPLFSDDELAAMVRTGGPGRQVAVARRDYLSETVTDALADGAVEEAVVLACANDNARFEEDSMNRVLDRFGYSEVVQGALIRRAVLPVAISERMIGLVSAALRDQLIALHAIRPETAVKIAMATRERATLDLSEQAGRHHDPEALARHLAENGRLTASLMLRALVRGHMSFFEHALAQLSGVPHARAWLMVHDAGSLGLRAIYDRAGLPARLFQTFRVAVDTWRALTAESAPFDRRRFQTLMIERFLTQVPYAPREDLIFLYEKLDRRPPSRPHRKAA